MYIITINSLFGPTMRCEARGMLGEYIQTYRPMILRIAANSTDEVLYEGTAVKWTLRNNHTMLTVFTVTTQETTFALAKIAEFNLYGYIMIQAEYPKLFILETQRGRTFKTRSKVSINNLDTFAYINSKFVYIEKHIKTQMSILYKPITTNIMEQKCALANKCFQMAYRSLASHQTKRNSLLE